eukprot:4958145-Pleurochrysis_carterae.AAC.3
MSLPALILVPARSSLRNGSGGGGAGPQGRRTARRPEPVKHSLRDCAQPDDSNVAVDKKKPPHLRPVSAVCCRYINGKPCGRKVVYTAPHYCEVYLFWGMSVMARVILRLKSWLKLSVEPWQSKVDNKTNKKLMKAKQAQSVAVIKLSPVLLELFEALWETPARCTATAMALYERAARQRGACFEA